MRETLYNLLVECDSDFELLVLLGSSTGIRKIIGGVPVVGALGLGFPVITAISLC